MQDDTSRRVLIIGLDGATFDLIRPWVTAGYLPSLAQLMAEGCQGPLASTIQPVTAPAWTTFTTGVNQGKHGLYDFVKRRVGGYDLEVTNASHISASTMFDIAGQMGRRVVAVNIPYTFPPRPVNGIMVGGPFAPTVNRDLVYPPTYFDTLKQVVPDYFILPDYDPRSNDPLKSYAQRLQEGIEMRERLSLHLLQTEPWDLFMTVFMATDEAQHAYWHCLEAPDDSPVARYRHVIRDVYQRIDQAIGKILAQIDQNGWREETVVMIVSDHGAGPLRWMINLNGWLAEKGYLQFQKAMHTPLKRLKATAIKHLARTYRHYVPGTVRAAIRSRLGTNRFDQVKGNVETALLTASINWDQTRAYALGAGGNIFINLKGREPVGIVNPGREYEQLRQEIMDALMNLADPETGQSIVRNVYPREALYSGPQVDQAPDLIVEWTDYAYWGRGRYDSLGSPIFEAQSYFEFSTLPLSGAHRPEGILIVQGPGIRSGNDIQNAHLWDMTPTILSLLSIRPNAEMDGRLLEDIFTEAELDRLLQTTTATNVIEHLTEQFDYSDEEAEKISEHLRSLGYL